MDPFADYSGHFIGGQAWRDINAFVRVVLRFCTAGIGLCFLWSHGSRVPGIRENDELCTDDLADGSLLGWPQYPFDIRVGKPSLGVTFPPDGGEAIPFGIALGERCCILVVQLAPVGAAAELIHD